MKSLNATLGRDKQISIALALIAGISFVLITVLKPASLFAQDGNGDKRRIRVAALSCKGANFKPIIRQTLEDQKDMRLTVLDGEDIRNGDLDGVDVLLVPGGLSKVESASIRKEGREEIRRFVGEGGSYIGICAGCYLATQGEKYLNLLPAKPQDTAHWRRGKAYLDLALTPLGQEVFGTDKQELKCLYHNGPVLRIFDDPAGSQARRLATYENEIVAPGGHNGIMTGAPAMVLTKFGSGWVLGISPHPEQTPGLENFLPNAIRWLQAHR